MVKKIIIGLLFVNYCYGSIVDYKVVSTEEVLSYLKKGYEPQGGVWCSQEYNYCWQAIIKKGD